MAKGGLQSFGWVVVLALAGPFAAWAQGAPPSSGEYLRALTAMVKPGKGASTRPTGGNDSCKWANDNECDEPGVGTGACAAGTDFSDCWRIVTRREDDSCETARDDECDEAGFGWGVCVQGSDRTDCPDVEPFRFWDDSCPTAFNGVCESGAACEWRTDRADCHGRKRVLTLRDHFFGRDERTRVDQSQLPWRAIGLLTFTEGGTCTGTLVAPNVVVTAAHCVHDDDGKLRAAGEFSVGERSAAIVDVALDPAWDPSTYQNSYLIDGTDWALLRIDRALGSEVGVAPGLGAARAGLLRDRRAVTLHQAGYSWDTGELLSAHLGCRLVETTDANTIFHTCDTTQGDSGSPILLDTPTGWRVIATDSKFRRIEGREVGNVAARAEGWVDRVAAFANGQGGLGRLGKGR